MKFSSRVTVTGIKGSKGVLENGKTYDSTKIYVQTPLDGSKGKGTATAEYSFGTSEEYERYKHLSFPLEVDVDLEIVSTGKSQVTQIVGFRPIEATVKSKAA